jgi:carbonic anhydrase/acetyltransferase-like protein (isoleucine patch superfamily)
MFASITEFVELHGSALTSNYFVGTVARLKDAHVGRKI